MPIGTVSWYDDGRSFGFIRPDDGSEDVLVHYSVIMEDGCVRRVGEDQKVEYDTIPGPEGPLAQNVRRVFGEDGLVSIVLCGDAVQVRVTSWGKPNLAKFADRLRPFGEVRHNPIVVRLRAPPYELSVFDDGRAIVKGTGEEAVARRLVTEWLNVRLPQPELAG
jgi:CspA family cold shock protein